MSRDAEDLNRRLLRARDAMDRAYAEPLDAVFQYPEDQEEAR